MMNENAINVGDWIRKWSILQPEKKALFFEGHPITYLQLNHRINKLCHLLNELRIRKGDRIAVLLHNSPEILETVERYKVTILELPATEI